MKVRVLLALLILASMVNAIEPSEFAAITPPNPADLTDPPLCGAENAWQILNDHCSGLILFYDQCIPSVTNQGTWEERSINCEVKYGTGFTCQVNKCMPENTFTGPWFYIVPSATILLALCILYIAWLKLIKPYMEKKNWI